MRLFINLKAITFAAIAALVLSGCATVASVVYPLNEQAERAKAGSYQLDPDHASVLFSINHFGFSEFRGRFDGVSGSMNLDNDAPENSAVSVEIDVQSLHTGVPELDDKLLASNMFNVEEFPVAKFTSGSITRTSEDTALIEGTLTINDVTQLVQLEAKFIGSGTNPLSGRQTIGFTATSTINRSDFGLSEWLPFVRDEVSLTIDAEFFEKR